MTKDHRFGWHYIGASIVAIVGLAGLLPALSADSPAPCCFDNDRFEGTCKVIPGDGDTCASILEYLNNPLSTGKSYCGGSAVRGGWVPVDCKKEKSPKQQCMAGTAAEVGKAVLCLPQNHLGNLVGNNLE